MTFTKLFSWIATIYSLLLLISPRTAFAQGDVNIKISQTSLNEVLSTLVDARALNFGEYTGAWITSGWFVNVDGATLTINSNNSVVLHANIAATAENVFNFIDNVTTHVTVNITGTFQLQSSGTGLKLIFSPTSASIVSGSSDLVSSLINTIVESKMLLVYRMGPFELNIGSQLLPSAITSYFTSSTPTLSTLTSQAENYVVLSYSVAGPRKITVQNETGESHAEKNVEIQEGGAWHDYSSPHPAWWDLNSSHSFRIASPNIEALGQHWKFKWWKEDNDPSIQKDITVTQDQTYTALFLSAQPITLQTNLIDGGNGGQIIYQGVPENSPYGDYAFMPPNNTTIGAPSSQLIGQYNRYFVNWNDGVTASTRIVAPTAPTTYVANLKAHLASGTSTALSNNSQRKLIKTNSTYHLVYQSGGEIWYTNSTDNGANWIQEQLLSAGITGTKMNPAIDAITVAGVTTIYVGYELVVDATHRELLLVSNSGSGWSGYYSDVFLASSDLKPVISALSGVLVVVQANGYTTSDPGLYCVDLTHGSTFKISETSSTSINPTLDWYNLAYQDGNAIYHTRITYSNPMTFSTRVMISTTTFNGRTLTNISNPSIALRRVTDGDRRPVIAWEAVDQADPTNKPIFVRAPVGHSTDGTPTFVTTAFDWQTACAHGKTPSVCCYMTPTGTGYENPDVSIVWQDDAADPSGTYQKVVGASRINGVWGSAFQLNSSAQSALVAQGDISQSGGGGALQISTAVSGSPYNLQYAVIPSPPVPQVPTGLSPPDGSTGVTLNVHPSWTCNPNADYYSYQFGTDPSFESVGTQSGETDLPSLTPETGSTDYGTTYYWRVMAHNSSGDGEWSPTSGFVTGFNPTAPTLSLTTILVNGQYHPKLSWTTLSGVTYPYKVYSYYCDVSGIDCYGSGNLISSPTTTTYTDMAVVVDIHNAVSTVWYYVKGTKTPGGGLSPSSNKAWMSTGNIVWQAGMGGHEDESPIVKLPTVTRSYSNYPNPFNPTTNFEYDLAQSAFVSLIVYNMLGQEVQRLVDRVQGIGRFHATWNAGTASSGMYYTRFIVVDMSGNEMVRETKKILLIK